MSCPSPATHGFVDSMLALALTPGTPGREPLRGGAAGNRDVGSRPRLSLVPNPSISPPPAAGSQAPARAGRLGLVTGLHDVDEVVRRAQRGDAAAFTELFRR